MADLLECLIQVKALRDTLGVSLDVRGDEGAGPAVWPRMADAERRYAAALGAAAGDFPPSGGGGDEARRAFAALRQANLAALERCTAADLSGEVAWPGRRSTTVADLVAIMLAHDTDALGPLRAERAGRQFPRPAPAPT